MTTLTWSIGSRMCSRAFWDAPAIAPANPPAVAAGQTIPRKHCEKVPKKVPRKIYRRIPRYFCEKKKGTFEFMDDLFG